MTLHKGGREVQVQFLGRGHTGGDTMVFLPAERIVFTGDFFEGRPGGGVLSYLGDSFIDEWPASLERLKALDFDIIVPGPRRAAARSASRSPTSRTTCATSGARRRRCACRA